MKRQTILCCTTLILIFVSTVQARTKLFDSNAVISDGDSYDTVVVEGDDTVVDMTGGYIKKLYTYDTSVFNMSDGYITGVRIADASTFNLSDGRIILLYCYDSSNVNVSGGSAYYGILCEDSSTGNIYGGSHGVEAWGSSKLNVYGGSHSSLRCFSSSTLNIYGGSSRLVDADSGTLNIYGGSIRDYLDCGCTPPVNIYGYSFDYDPTGGNYGYGQVTGFYANQTAFSFDLGPGSCCHINLIYVPKAVDVDIKPASCPNPLNVKSKGVLPVAILGSEDLDVNAINIASVRLDGVAPVRSSYEDVAAPLADANECECTTEGPDGYLDLTLKFKTQEIVEVIGEVNHGDVLTLPLTGVLFGERPIEGADCVVIHGKHKPLNRADFNGDGIVDMADFAAFTENWLQ